MHEAYLKLAQIHGLSVENRPQFRVRWQEMRDDLGLDPGMAVEIAREADGLWLRRIEGEPAVEERRGVLVFVGEAQGDLKQAIDRHRVRPPPPTRPPPARSLKILFDTSVLVAAVVAAHPDHSRALPWLERAKKRQADFLVAAHTLAEMYAVLVWREAPPHGRARERPRRAAAGHLPGTTAPGRPPHGRTSTRLRVGATCSTMAVMRRASVREARQNLSALLEHVAKGHEVLITSRGQPAARLVPPRPRTGKPFPDRSALRRSMPRLDPPLSTTVAEGREDRG